VAALGALTGQPRLYTARPILVSGTCKREDARQHAGLLKTALNTCESKSSTVHGCIYCIASDGEAKRGAALVALALVHPLASTSPIYPQLHPLPLFNTLCGKDDLTLDKDFKHILK
jgi:hypothetical protein